jgi:DHA2 family multidrug resistance protein
MEMTPGVLLRRQPNPWLIAVAVVIPTFMEVLDTTIANVALRYIAGGLSAASVDSEWVITSYLAANAIVLPLSGWLLTRLGRRNYFLGSMAVFTGASFFCGTASSLNELILFRVIQGLAGGGLQPCTQGVLLDTFPKEKQGQAMTMFGLAALVAPVIGPTLGGYITDNYSWRWIFFINVPVGILAVAACYWLVQDPSYLVAERSAMRAKAQHFDLLGLILLSVTMICWEVVLSKGQEWDWFGDPFYRIQILSALCVTAFLCLIFRELTFTAPILNFRPLLDRNFTIGAIIIASAYLILYAQTFSLPNLLQTLFGYDATHSGLVLSPAGVFAVALLPVIGFLLGKGTDARWLIMAGLAFMGLGNYWLSQQNLQMGPWDVVWPRVVTIIGLTTLFAPLSVAVYQNIPPQLRGAAVGLFSLVRNEGGSVGTSMAQTLQERRLQFHSLRLNEFLDPLNLIFVNYQDQIQTGITLQEGDPVTSRESSLAAIADQVQNQANSLAYFDVFWVCAVFSALLIPLVLFMRRSVAEKGAHLAAD